MTRLLSYGSMFLVTLMLLLPAAAMAQSPTDERGVLVGVREDLTLDATSSASVVVGVQGNVTVSGHARLVVMVDGTSPCRAPRHQWTRWSPSGPM